MSLESMRQWVGRTKAAEDFAAPFPVRALTATFDEQDPVQLTAWVERTTLSWLQRSR